VILLSLDDLFEFYRITFLPAYSDIAIPLFGLALLVLGFGTLYMTLRTGMSGGEISTVLIVSAIMTSIIGFGLIILGNYLLYAIYGATC
jgi:hypothetical protein